MAFPQPTSQTAAPLEALAGTVERVTYHNAENGFAVRQGPEYPAVIIPVVTQHYEATDVAATVLANLREEPPPETWDGTTIGAVLRATTIALSAPLALVLAWLWRKRQVAQRG
jgi:hypothetical protein